MSGDGPTWRGGLPGSRTMAVPVGTACTVGKCTWRLPTLSPLFPLACAEAQTFLASLRTALGLEPSATLEACANRLEQALADRCRGED